MGRRVKAFGAKFQGGFNNLSFIAILLARFLNIYLWGGLFHPILTTFTYDPKVSSIFEKSERVSKGRGCVMRLFHIFFRFG
jgi:hypothetical protein